MIPNYKNRSPEQIITQSVYFDSVGYTYRALSWLDMSKKTGNICALQYAALDARQAIEHLLFEEIVLSVGTKLDHKDYQNCKGNSTKFYKIILRLNPDFQRLAKFSQAIMETEPGAPRIIVWDHQRLMRYWGNLSNYLHWDGEPKETVESREWFKAGLDLIEAATEYIWSNKTQGLSGIMMPYNMEPEIEQLWEKFKRDEMDIEAVKRAANLLYPLLQNRRKKP